MVNCKLILTNYFDFSSKSVILIQNTFTIIDSSQKELCLLDEMDNPVTFATLSSLRESKEINEKHN